VPALRKQQAFAKPAQPSICKAILDKWLFSYTFSANSSFFIKTGMKITPLFLFYGFALHAQSWVQLSDFPGNKRDDGVAVIVGNKAYVGTGLRDGWSLGGDFYALDLNNYTWASVSDMPVGTERQYACAFPGTGGFYVLGGDGVGGVLNNMFRYDIGTDAWSVVTSKPGAVIKGASVMAFGDKVIVAGGKASDSGPVNQEVWEYQVSINVWNQKANLPFKGRFRASSAVMNGKGYFMFGIDDSSHYRREVYRYDPVNDVWTQLTDFPGAGRAYAALQASAKRLVLFGGHDEQDHFYNDVWYYNDTTATWSQGPSMPAAPRRGDMSCLKGDRFIFSCGLAQGNLHLKETWLMDVPLSLGANQTSGGFSVYPNPANDIIHIEGTGQARMNYSLEDLLGKCVISTCDSDINVSALPKGIYFLHVLQNGTIAGTKKIVKY
jgi:N-acetylneuraminic acid mutarotase